MFCFIDLKCFELNKLQKLAFTFLEQVPMERSTPSTVTRRLPAAGSGLGTQRVVELNELERKRQWLALIETLCEQAKFKQIVSDLDAASTK